MDLFYFVNLSVLSSGSEYSVILVRFYIKNAPILTKKIIKNA